MTAQSKCELLTVQQVAELLQVPVSWVYGRMRTRSQERLPAYVSGSIGDSIERKYWRGSRATKRIVRLLDMPATLRNDAEQAGRAIETPKKGETMARRGFQQGSLFQRGTRRKVWVARWWEDVIQADGTLGRLRRSEVIGTVADYPARRRAMQVLSQRLGSINSGKARPQSVRTFGDFVKDDWMPVVLPTLKYATQKHYRYMLDVHLIPAFGKRQLRELSPFLCPSSCRSLGTQVSDLASGFLARVLRDSPRSSMRWALCTRRSRMPSAMVASPICSCHWATGTCEVRIVERV